MAAQDIISLPLGTHFKECVVCLEQCAHTITLCAGLNKTNHRVCQPCFAKMENQPVPANGDDNLYCPLCRGIIQDISWSDLVCQCCRLNDIPSRFSAFCAPCTAIQATWNFTINTNTFKLSEIGSILHKMEQAESMLLWIFYRRVVFINF